MMMILYHMLKDLTLKIADGLPGPGLFMQSLTYLIFFSVGLLDCHL